MGRKKKNKVSLDQLLIIAHDKEQLYKERPDEMVAAFNRETETTKGYNGRQILELIQNCDDEGSNKVLIKLNKEEQILSIYNEGTPFSIKGYRSLFISNLSSKTSKRNYIGNKGLGFRSILNWSKSIEIISNDISVSFSKAIKKRKFFELFNEKERKHILKENNFKSHVIPIPFLSAAEIKTYESPRPYTTVIHISYVKRYYDDIIKQIESLDIETLLFLKHIEEINFQGLPELEDINCEKKELPLKKLFGPTEEVRIEDEDWKIFKREGDLISTNESLRDEKEFYELKIAISNDPINRPTRLYSYFPTNIKLTLPYIIHGTFDLDSTRNHLNISDENKIVLTELVKLITNTAKYFAKKEANWFPLKMLNQDNGQNGRLEDLEYYEQLDKAIKKEKVWPCLDGKYRPLSKVVYFNDEFSQFIQHQELNDLFPNMLIPLEDLSDLGDKYSIINTFNDEIERINRASKRITNIEIRAEFIRIVCGLYTNIKADLLINKYNRILKSNRTVYSPAEGELLIPSYCRIDIINRELYNALVAEFELSYREHELARELLPIIEFRPFEPITIAQKIISATKQQINKKHKDAKTKVLESIKALWNNYQLSSNIGDLQSNDVPLINAKGSITLSSMLFLSSSYNSGKLTEKLFSEVYPLESFLASPEIMGIEGDEETIEEFFFWLGVNHLTKWKKITYNSQKNNRRSAVLSEIIKNEVGLEYKKYNYRIEYETIFKLDKIISKLSKEEILVWLSNDLTLSERILEAEYEDSLKYFPKSGSINNNSFDASFDYIYFFFKAKNIDFTEHIVDSKINWINKYNIDYNHPIFRFSKLSKRNIDNLLIKLGAKEDFIDLPIERVFQILKSLPEKFPNGKYSKVLYKKAVDHYNENNEYLEGNIKLFAMGEKGLGLYKPEEIYFSDRVKIPKKMQSEYPVLNFPPRAGGRSAIEFFQINDLADVKIEIESFNRSNRVDEEFEQYLQRIKQYILVYRLNRVNREELKEKEARKLNKLKLILCNKLSFRVGNNIHGVNNYEFIPDDENYYIKIQGNESLHELRKNSEFSDIFSEIVAHFFDTESDKNDFRYILRDEETDIIYSIKNQFGEDALSEAESLIGSIDYRAIFWSTIIQCIDHDFDSIDIQRKKLIRQFRHLTIDYRNINNSSNYYALLEIFKVLGISIGDFNRNTNSELSLVSHHRNNLENLFLNKKKFIMSSVWTHLKNKTSEEQMQFLEIVNWFENRETFIDKETDKEEFELDYEKIFSKFYRKTFKHIPYEEQFIDLTSMEEENKKRFNNYELTLINENPNYRSLMYFNNSLNYLKKIIKRVILDQKKNEEHDQNINLEIEFLDPKEYSTKSKKPRKHNNKVYVHNVEIDRKNKSIGDKAESLIYEHLINQYGEDNVSWESRMNEGLHYDIRYSPDKGNSWIFVEVKALSYDYFFISPAEKEFGEVNNDKYEIWLLTRNNKIKVLKDFFKGGNHKLIPNKYIVYINA